MHTGPSTHDTLMLTIERSDGYRARLVRVGTTYCVLQRPTLGEERRSAALSRDAAFTLIRGELARLLETENL